MKEAIRRRLALLALLVPIFGAGTAHGADQTLRLIVPYAPGGLNDIFARALAPHLAAGLGNPVIVENRPGAGGVVGTQAVLASAPDGRTLLVSPDTPLVAAPFTEQALPYDPAKDVAPVIALGYMKSIIAVNPAVPAKNVAELIDYARKTARELDYATPGAVSPSHFLSELFARQAGIKMFHVPYKSGSEATQSVLAGYTKIIITGAAPLMPYVQSGALRALAVFGTDSIEELPGVASLDAQGIKGFSKSALPTVIGIVAPARTPREAIMRVNMEVNRILALPEVGQQLRHTYVEVIGGTPEDFGVLLRAGRTAWGQVARELGLGVKR